MKTNYYRLARLHHPDRVNIAEKGLAQEKFAVLHQAYAILSNPESKKLYDSGKGQVLFKKSTIAGTWEKYVRPIDVNEIECARNKYQNSATEETDIIREFIIGKGSITHLFNTIAFMRSEDEPRIIELVQRCMNMGKIPKIPIRKLRKAQ